MKYLTHNLNSTGSKQLDIKQHCIASIEKIQHCNTVYTVNTLMVFFAHIGPKEN